MLTESDSESIWREVVCMEDPIPVNTVALETHFSQETVSRLKLRRSEVSFYLKLDSMTFVINLTIIFPQHPLTNDPTPTQIAMVIQHI